MKKNAAIIIVIIAVILAALVWYLSTPTVTNNVSDQAASLNVSDETLNKDLQAIDIGLDELQADSNNLESDLGEQYQ